METSYVNFVRDVGSNGQRLDLHPRMSRPISLAGLATLTPFVGGRLTGYDKTVIGTRTTRGGVPGTIEITEDETRLRRLFEAGADLETQLARVYPVGGTWGIDALLHTIEPRLNYTWITGKDQDRLPQWTDVDNIPDTSRITYSLTNRLRARTVTLADGEPRRWEALRVAVGSSYDIRDSSAGDVVGTVIVQPVERVRVRGDIAHSVHGQGVQSATSDLAVRLDAIAVSVGSRYSDPGRFNFVTTGVVADVTRYVTLRNTNFFDIRTRTFVESRASADIKFQCWALTVEYVHRENRDDEVNFAVNLLGVGGPIRTSIGLGALEGLGER
jgi:LPS transport system D